MEVQPSTGLMLEGDINIDESLFGRRCKYNLGNPKVGIKVWIFGLVSRSTNTLILYPVDKRDAETLIPIIKRHVPAGARIFSDSWAAYFKLNALGYEHFTVCHKTSFKATYNKSTLDNSPPPNYDKESKDECHHVNNNARYKWYVKPAAFQVIAPTRSNYGRKINVKNRNKSTILIFLPAIIELVQELLISNMHNKLEEDTCENVEVIVPTRSNY